MRSKIGGASVVFSPSTGKYGPEKTPYLDTFHAVLSNEYGNVNFRKHLLLGYT